MPFGACPTPETPSASIDARGFGGVPAGAVNRETGHRRSPDQSTKPEAFRPDSASLTRVLRCLTSTWLNSSVAACLARLLECDALVAAHGVGERTQVKR